MQKSIIAVLFICVCVVWGSTWFAMEIAVQSLSSPMVNALRFAIASPIVVVIALIAKKPLLFPSGAKRWMLPISIVYFAIPFTLMTYSELYVSPGLSAIIFSLMPLVVVFISRFFDRVRLSRNSLIGLLIAIVTLSLIVNLELDLTQNPNAYKGIISLALALSLHALVYVYTKHKLNNIDVLTFNAIPAFVASLFLFMFSCLNGLDSLNGVNASTMFAIAYLAVFGSVLGIVAYCKLNQLVSSFTASLCFLTFPLVSLIISTALKGDVLSPLSITILPIYLLGVYLIIRNKKEYYHES